MSTRSSTSWETKRTTLRTASAGRWRTQTGWRLLTAIRLQETAPGAGRTDIEVESERLHLIVEAKRGWTLPLDAQLRQYAGRFEAGRESAILVVSEGSKEYASPRLDSHVEGVPVQYLPWADVAALVDRTAVKPGMSHAEKRLLRELVRYLKGLMTMQNVTSNMVYVVSLGTEDLFGTGLSFADIVVKHDCYFHPMGGGPGGWPKTPPNYLGFRFDGELQQVRHVDGYEVMARPWETISPLEGKTDWEDDRPHFMYAFGPVIQPARPVRTGKLYRAQRVWAALDLLLTSSTIAEARDKTNERLAEVGET